LHLIYIDRSEIPRLDSFLVERVHIATEQTIFQEQTGETYWRIELGCLLGISIAVLLVLVVIAGEVGVAAVYLLVTEIGSGMFFAGPSGRLRSGRDRLQTNTALFGLDVLLPVIMTYIKLALVKRIQKCGRNSPGLGELFLKPFEIILLITKLFSLVINYFFE
jgi:hypothetical protein